MRGRLLAALLALSAGSGLAHAQSIPAELPVITVTRPGTVIDRSCRVRIPAGVVLPAPEGGAALLLRGDDLTVHFESGSWLRGQPLPAETTPDGYRGLGLRLEGTGIRLHGVRITGYKVGLHAEGCDRLELVDARVEDTFRQRLGSTPEREDAADWLRPHDNDRGEWRARYGAALSIRNASGVTVRGARVRSSQNGLLLDRVRGATVSGCDLSFLSGWGLAMWRSDDNRIASNTFAFCIRGYSHGVYNRGQDSAGILLFEQCNRNVFLSNSVTHGGDGLFAFAGNEALSGEERRGCNDNVFAGNDFSFAAAHGLELTFSAGGRIRSNLFEGNAICGIWGGYSQELLIRGNRFVANGDAGYGRERGGIAIEHGWRNRIVDNRFERNRCGVRMWEDDDGPLRERPWVRANWKGARENLLARNHFSPPGEGPAARWPALELSGTKATLLRDTASAADAS
jgi:hypothetical protein